MVISTITSGLGNQLFQYALGRQLAILNNTSLYFDTRFYQSEYSRETNRSFRLSNFNINFRELSVREENLIRATKLLPGRSLPPLFRHLKEQYYHFDPDVLKARAGMLVLNGYWHSQKYFIEVEDVIRRELAFNNMPGPEFSSYKSDILSSDKAVSVHIRRGDYVSHPEFSKTFGFIGKQYYENACALIVKRIGSCRFFVFTDDKDWVEQNMQLPGDTLFVKNTGADADLDDLHLMSLCKHHIVANSSYSWWGAWLGANRDKIVVCPENWFLNQPDWNTKDLRPDSWIKI